MQLASGKFDFVAQLFLIQPMNFSAHPRIASQEITHWSLEMKGY